MEIYNGPYCVYVHLNKVNGKSYVGITKKKNPNGRWHSGKGYSYNIHFDNAIKKYGWDNFEHIIFAANLTEQEASNMERMLIEKLFSTDQNHGYNLCEGGYNNRALCGDKNPFFGKVPQKAVEASVAARTGKPLSETQRRHIAEGNLGRIITPEERRKISEAQKGKPRPYTTGAKNGNSKQVKCVETGEIFDTMTMASIANNVSISSIYQSVKFGTRSNKKHWVFL